MKNLEAMVTTKPNTKARLYDKASKRASKTLRKQRNNARGKQWAIMGMVEA